MIAAGGARDHGIMSRCPFTPTQWQELEHQALIFKYMVSGTPIPPELIYSIKRSLDSSLASRLFPPQHVGWSCYQLGFGRKADPEPGRCRRTDGKKWRCSKEAYPDSKYCERHMHRGRNRSRKPVEAACITSSSSPTTTSLTAAEAATNPCSSVNRKLSINSSPNSSPYAFSPLSSCFSAQLHAADQDTSHQKSINNISQSHMIPFLNPQSSSSSSRPLGSSGFLTHDSLNAHHLFLDSGSCSQTDKDYSSYNFHGIRGSAAAVDERTFFPEASESLRSFQGSCHPPLVTIDSSYNKATDNNPHHHPQFQSISDCSHQQQQQQHCFVLGSDFKPSAAAEAEAARQVVKVEKDDETPKSQPLHHFFGEWPPKNTDSWLDLSSTNSRIQSDG